MSFRTIIVDKINLNEEQMEEEVKLKCNVCLKTYENASNLKNHLRSHFDKNYLIYCHVCAKTVAPWKLKAHLRSHSTTEQPSEKLPVDYKCRFCSLSFDKSKNRTTHEQRIHKSKENDGLDHFKCKDKECGLIFRTQEELRDHSFIHFNGKVHYCDFPGCDRKFKKGKLVTVHKKTHFDPQVKCLDCGQMFVQKAGLLKHQKFSRCPVKKDKKESPPSDVIENMAKVAQEQFVSLKGRLKSSFNDTETQACSDEEVKLTPESEDWHYEYLEEDLIDTIIDDTQSNPFEAIEEIISDQVEIKSEPIEIEEPPKKTYEYECDLCGKQFISRNSIFSHLSLTHKLVADFNCQICYGKFKSQGNLSRHIKSMHSQNARHWNCDKCGAMFKEKYQLETHSHNHDQPTKCGICGKMIANIKVHMRFHATKGNNTLVECLFCNRKMGKYQLARHVRNVHELQYKKEPSTSNVRIYSCNQCEETFFRINELRQHTYLTHSQNNKIYECAICGRIFGKLKLLNVHRFTHQPQNVKCKKCDKVYARKAALYKHTKKSHPESYVNPKSKSSEWNEIEVEWSTEI